MDRRIRIETDKVPASTGYRSNAMVAAGFVFTSGHIGAPISTPENRIPPAPTLEEQVDLCLQHMEQLVLAGGGTKERVIEVSAFVVPFEKEEIVRQRVRSFLGWMPRLYNVHPVGDVAMHGLLEMDGIAVIDTKLTLEQAAEILRPFGHGQGLVRSGPFVMINGLTALGASLGEQTTNLLADADRLFRQAGTMLSNAVKLTAYNADFESYPQFSEATRRAFSAFEPPARSVLVAPQITGDALLKMDLLALAGE